MNRHLKLTLPVAKNLLIPDESDQVQNEILPKKQQSKSFYDRHAKIEHPRLTLVMLYIYSHLQEIGENSDYMDMFKKFLPHGPML